MVNKTPYVLSHLTLNMRRFTTYSMIKDEIIGYLESKWDLPEDDLSLVLDLPAEKTMRTLMSHLLLHCSGVRDGDHLRACSRSGFSKTTLSTITQTIEAL